MKRRGFLSTILSGLATLAVPFAAKAATPIDTTDARIINAMSTHNGVLVSGATYGFLMSDYPGEEPYPIAVTEQVEFKNGKSYNMFYAIPYDYPNKEVSAIFIINFLESKKRNSVPNPCLTQYEPKRRGVIFKTLV